jgi:glutamine amidotransferase
MIAIIDYDAGNIKSVEKACLYLGQDVKITRDRDEILEANHVILPGVGAFGDAMQHLKEYHLVQTIYDVVEKKIPFLGICLGQQLLFERSDESRGVSGLGILPGEIVSIPPAPGLKIPHMGWNSLEITPDTRLFKGIDNHSYVYFVHSYYLKAKRPSDVAARTWYSVNIDAAVESDSVFACQFHPEKSSQIGLRILKNFTEI